MPVPNNEHQNASQKKAEAPDGAFLIPAYNPGSLLGQVLADLIFAKEEAGLQTVPIIVVDDGSTDETFKSPDRLPSSESLVLLRHLKNQGKGSALLTGFSWAHDRGIKTVVTLDADAQHPPSEAVRIFQLPAAQDSLVLGVRDLSFAGAPSKNQASNAFSNWVLSLMSGTQLHDTQCGLRRYPLESSLVLGARSPGYAFESDLVLRAARRGIPIVHEPCTVIYPNEAERVTFFDSVRDPARIVLQVVKTSLLVPHHRASRRWGKRLLGLGLLALLILSFL